MIKGYDVVVKTNSVGANVVLGLTLNQWQMVDMSQTACNLSGIVHSLSNMMTALWQAEEAKTGGTEWVNKHPAVRLFLEQLAFLNGQSIASGMGIDYYDASTVMRAALEALQPAKVLEAA